eukprot:2644433-Amphidinium_carterae.1
MAKWAIQSETTRVKAGQHNSEAQLTAGVPPVGEVPELAMSYMECPPPPLVSEQTWQRLAGNCVAKGVPELCIQCATQAVARKPSSLETHAEKCTTKSKPKFKLRQVNRELQKQQQCVPGAPA